MGRHVARMEQSRNAYIVLVGKPESKRPLGRPRRRWENNIKIDLREVMQRPDRSYSRYVPTAGLCKGGNEPQDSLKANYLVS